MYCDFQLANDPRLELGVMDGGEKSRLEELLLLLIMVLVIVELSCEMNLDWATFSLNMARTTNTMKPNVAVTATTPPMTIPAIA